MAKPGGKKPKVLQHGHWNLGIGSLVIVHSLLVIILSQPDHSSKLLIHRSL